MPQDSQHDAVVIGAGPNGLSAALTLALNGRSCLVLEAAETIGGACRSAATTLPGFVHDVGSAIHPMGVGSPFFQTLPLDKFGLEWVHPRVPLAHPFDDEPAVVLSHDIDTTAQTFNDEKDAAAYKRWVGPFADKWPVLAKEVFAPAHVPLHPLLMGRFGMRAARPIESVVNGFRTQRARGLLAGLAGHASLPMDHKPSAAIALLLAAAGHSVGWPMPKGGAQALANALAGYFQSLGGEIQTGRRVTSFRELPPARCYLFDVTPRQLLAILGDELPGGYAKKLQKFRYGPGVFKIDYALSAPVPWKDPALRYAGTVHLGGTYDEIATSERAPWQGDHARYPLVLLAQPTRFDYSRAPAGKHVVWAYCHVPNGSTFDMEERITAQIERFAPGFRDLILAKAPFNTARLEQVNPNLVGGDITGGALTWDQLLTRPAGLWQPYATPDRRYYLCSASTPPGGSVHGMCGYHAAMLALRRSLK